MKGRKPLEPLDRNHPIVQGFRKNGGLCDKAVSIRLASDSVDDLAIQARRLRSLYGPMITMSNIVERRDGNGFVVFATILA